MKLELSKEDEAFRATVRQFFETEYPKDVLHKTANGIAIEKQDHLTSEQALAARGWLAVNWPVEHGGTGWTPTQKMIFDDELERAGALNPVPMGVIYVGPVIYTFGTEAQKERWLPDILNGRVLWAQGYSEPDSGSDLASLQCKAELDGDHYVVNGTKVWTSLGHFADWIFCLVRTSKEEKKQAGITFLCTPMDAPGIRVDPIITINGAHTLNAVHFDNVRIPIENRIGEEGKAWTYANYLLGHERTSYAHVGEKRIRLKALKDIARQTDAGGAPLWDDPAFRAKVTRVDMELDALESTLLRIVSELAQGDAPGPAASALKILATENQQHIDELFVEAAAYWGHVKFPKEGPPSWASNTAIPGFAPKGVGAYLGNRAQSIYGGTNEIQHNVIAKRVLGF